MTISPDAGDYKLAAWLGAAGVVGLPLGWRMGGGKRVGRWGWFLPVAYLVPPLLMFIFK